MSKIVHSSLFHLKSGSPMPPLVKNKLRVYSMVFCPYAQRPRLILEAKNIEYVQLSIFSENMYLVLKYGIISFFYFYLIEISYETINLNLHKKPEWFLKLNPLGKVPCLHFPEDGRVLPESIVLCEYLDEVYGGGDGGGERLLPADSYLKAIQKLDIEVFNKTIGLFYQTLRNRDKNEDSRLFEKLSRSLTRFESKLKHDFLAGSYFLTK